MQEFFWGQILFWALEMDGGGGKNLATLKYTPLYKKGIKKTQNKLMETTNGLYF